MSRPYAPQMKTFADWWIRAGHPAEQELHAVIGWNTAVDVTCEVLAKRLEGVTAEQLKALAADVKGKI